MNNLKRVILLAAELRETSYITASNPAAFIGDYSLTIALAVKEAIIYCELEGQDLEFPSIALLSHSWNEALEWAGGADNEQ